MFWVPNTTAAASATAATAGYIPARTPSESGSEKVNQSFDYFWIIERPLPLAKSSKLRAIIGIADTVSGSIIEKLTLQTLP